MGAQLDAALLEVEALAAEVASLKQFRKRNSEMLVRLQARGPRPRPRPYPAP